MKSQKPWKAVILSLLVTGLGHIYAGSPRRGFSIFAVTALYLILIRFIAFGLFVFSASLILFFIYWVYVAFNAYQLSSYLRDKGVPSNQNWRPYLLMVMMLVFWQVSLNTKTFQGIPNVAFATVPSSSCAPTLRAGDHFAYENTKDIKRYDLTLYEQDDILYVKRTIGAPGDTIEIKNGLAYANARLIDDRQYTMTSAMIKFKDSAEVSRFWFTKNEIVEHSELRDMVFVNLSKGSLSKMIKGNQKEIKEILPYPVQGTSSGDLFPSEINWDIDNYGPLIVPKIGWKVKLTSESINKYSAAILSEGENIQLHGGLLFRDGAKLEDYTFLHNYYYMLGDNRHNSRDSRYFGFIRDDAIVGKALYIWWSDYSTRIGLPLNYRSVISKKK